MLENENLVGETTENAEQTAEETPVVKTYTQEEVDAIVGKRLARQQARIKKDYDRKYGDLENVIRAGTGMQTPEEMTEGFTKFYEGKGLKIRKEPEYSAKDLETLAKAEADEIIRGGDEEVVDEVERLATLGADKMSARERAVFEILANHRANTEKNKKLSSIGVTKDVYDSTEFKEFASQFNSDVPMERVYNLFKQTTQPKKEFKTMGSMKNNPSDDGGVKEYYSKEEAEKFTLEDFNKNPELYKNVVNSSYRWK